MNEFISLYTLNFLNLIAIGPSALMMFNNGSLYGRRIAIYTALGIVTASFIHKTYTLAGLSYLINNNPIVFETIKYIGAVHLIYLAINNLFMVRKANELTQDSYIKNSKGFSIGFFTDLFNPTASLSFISIVAISITNQTPFWLKMSYVIPLILTSLVYYSFLAFLFSKEVVQRKIKKYNKYVAIITSCVYVGLSVKMFLL